MIIGRGCRIVDKRFVVAVAVADEEGRAAGGFGGEHVVGRVADHEDLLGREIEVFGDA